MTDTFGDADPEDAWDPDDPLPDLVRNLLRRLTRNERDRALELVRADMFARDLALVLDRLELEAGD